MENWNYPGTHGNQENDIVPTKSHKETNRHWPGGWHNTLPSTENLLWFQGEDTENEEK